MLLMLALLALVPVRSFAAVMDTGGAMGAHMGTQHGHVADVEQRSTRLEGRADRHSRAYCSCCAEHCASASVADSRPVPVGVTATLSEPPGQRSDAASGVIPGDPQPPALAS